MRQLKITQRMTNREAISIDKYLLEVSKEKMITVEEEAELAARIKKGDERALDALVKANLRFVISVAKQYPSPNLPLSDLISEGNIGLIKAAKRFDATRGFKFISYAVWWIRQSILQALADSSRTIRLPQNRIAAITQINKAYIKLEQEFERPPTDAEMAEFLDTSVEDVRRNLISAQRGRSLDEPLRDDYTSSGGSSMSDSIASEEESDDGLIQEGLKKEINIALKMLTPRESNIINLCFSLNGNEPMSLQEIGERYNITSERVRQIREKGLKRLKHFSRKKPLNFYLS
tara:strand:+ start:767 stop:1636 length:870 start_codon:yes stop_codon:yes gene_type:complete